MGMFDNIRCKYPLSVEGANALVYQTKDTPAQFLDLYEIREDGTLWHEDYDTEDQSEAAHWLADNPGKELPEELNGLSALFGCMARVNERWVQVTDFTGEIRFYATLPSKYSGWIEWSADFEAGQVVQMNLIENAMDKQDDKLIKVCGHRTKRWIFNPVEQCEEHGADIEIYTDAEQTIPGGACAYDGDECRCKEGCHGTMTADGSVFHCDWINDKK